MAGDVQKAICILGMHRSGTSAVARALNLLGAYLGPPEKMMSPHEQNPEGFWEHRDIVDLHNRLLQDLSSTWDTLTPLPQEWWKLPAVEPYHQELGDLIQQEFANQSLWIWKDPRTCLLLPLWQKVLEALGIEVAYVIVLRNPLDVAASLQKRDGFTKVKALALWQLYTLSALSWTAHTNRVIVHYDAFLEDWENCLKRVLPALAIGWPKDVMWQESVVQFLKPGLRHSYSNETDLLLDKEVRNSTAALYFLLRRTESTPTLLATPTFTEKIARLAADYRVELPTIIVPTIQTYWGTASGFSEQQSASARVVIDEEWHEYDFRVVVEAGSALRVDPVNFPAYVEIRSVALWRNERATSETQLIASWMSEEKLGEVTFGPHACLVSNDKGTLGVLATADDPWLLFPPVSLHREGRETDEMILRVSMRVTAHPLGNLASILESQQHTIEHERRAYHDLERAVEYQQRAYHDLEGVLAHQREAHQSETELKDIHVRNLEGILTDKETTLAQMREALHMQEETVASSLKRIEELQGALQSKGKLGGTLRTAAQYLKQIFRWPRRHRMELTPIQDIVVEEYEFRSTGEDPQFLLRSSLRQMPEGWVILSYQTKSLERWLHPTLYIDTGAGFLETQKIALRRPLRVRTLTPDESKEKEEQPSAMLGEPTVEVQFLVFLTGPVRALRLNFYSSPARFFLKDLILQEIGTLQVGAILLWRHLRPVLFHPRQLWQMLLRNLEAFTVEDARTMRRRFLLQEHATRVSYEDWIQAYDTVTDSDRAAIRQQCTQLSYSPLISVIMPTYNTPEQWLRRAIDSVQQQLYPHWELCIADDASVTPHVKAVLEHYQAADPRIKVTYREQNGHIAAASNSALALATGEFIALLDHDDELPEHALFIVAAELNTHPEAALIYSDEDKIDEQGQRHSPYFKPDWNPELFLGQNLISHLGVYRTRLVRDLGGFREGYEGSQDWDLAIRMIERIPVSHIRHVPHVLYHWRSIPGSTAVAVENKDYAREAQCKLLVDHFERIGVEATILPGIGPRWRVKYPLPQTPPLVTLIIPTRNRFDLLYRCVQSIYQKTTYPNFEICIVDNQSDDPQTLTYLQQLAERRGVKVLRYDAPFNYAAINNFAVRQTQGEILGLLNNDLEVISPDWLEEMVSYAVRPEIGAVGAMLYYPNDTIQHAGVIVGLLGVAGHIYASKPRGYVGQMGRALLAQNLSAVTAACLVMRRGVFVEVGGLDETNLAVAFNDVDLCLRVTEKGYRNVWTPYAELYHHESASRGYEDTLEKQFRFKREIAYMQWHWRDLLRRDPAYNPNLTLEQGDFTLAFPPRRRKPWQ